MDGKGETMSMINGAEMRRKLEENLERLQIQDNLNQSIIETIKPADKTENGQQQS